MITCPKCGYKSGNDWTQCVGGCPMKMSPHFDPVVAAQYEQLEMDERPFVDNNVK